MAKLEIPTEWNNLYDRVRDKVLAVIAQDSDGTFNSLSGYQIEEIAEEITDEICERLEQEHGIIYDGGWEARTGQGFVEWPDRVRAVYPTTEMMTTIIQYLMKNVENR